MSPSAPTLVDHNRDCEETVTQAFPAVKTWLEQENTTLFSLLSTQTAHPITTVSAIQETVAQTKAHNVTAMTQEELADITQKLKELATLPNAPLDTSTRLYLEQQVADLLGFAVTSQQGGYNIPIHSGVCAAEFVDSFAKPLSSPDFSSEYLLRLPLHLLPEWRENPLQVKAWFAKQKILLLNPFDGLTCVARCGDVGPDYSFEYQLGASPKLIQATKLWSYNAQGHCLLFFVEEPELVELGTYPLLPDTGVLT